VIIYDAVVTPVDAVVTGVNDLFCGNFKVKDVRRSSMLSNVVRKAERIKSMLHFFQQI